MSRALLVEVDVTSPAGAASTLRFADRAVRPFPPTDADRPNAVWDDRLKEAPSLRRALFDDLTSLAPGLGFGAMTLANADRGLDTYQGYAWGEVRVWRWTEGTTFAAAELILKGLVSQPGFGLDSASPKNVVVPLYDYRAELEGPLQTNAYAGTNGVGGVLYEGLADGLKGKVKPLAFGNLLDAHIAAPQVNPGVFAYQLHDGAVSGSEQWFDRGDSAGLADDNDFSGSAFDSHSLSAAHYCTDLGRGLLKANTSPVGAVTFGVKGDSSGGYVETTGPILARLLSKAGVPGARIASSVAALSSTAVIGAYFGDQVAARDAVGWVAKSAAVALLPDRQGIWTATPLAAPAGIEDHAIASDEVIKVEADDTASAPAGEVRVGWGRVWTTFKGTELAPALKGTASETRLGAEYRYAVAVDASAKARFPRTWRTLTIETALRSEADAQALANTLRDLFGLRSDGKPRRMWRVTVDLTSARLALALGKTVLLNYPAAGISDRFLFIAEEPLRPKRDQAIWTLWG